MGVFIIGIIDIESDSLLEDFNHHFKVIAGPGAGKTFWLTENIRNIAKNSHRLTNTSKIACISYTNVAANEIIERLNLNSDIVEVSTIHSFLYKNIIKPYIYLLKDESGKNLITVEYLRGHKEHIPHYLLVKKWVDEISESENEKYLKLQYQNKKNAENLNKSLKKIVCTIDDGGNCIFTIINSGLFPKILKNNLYSYKKQYWSKGIIDHNDVLFLSYCIIKQNPDLVKFISSRYRYIFLDEFQDTNPVQTEIIATLGKNGSIIGVIGDPSQSIYSFNGARREDFLDFMMPNLQTYKIKGNRRSDEKIVDFLNKIRKDDPCNLTQKCEKSYSHNLAVELIISSEIKEILDQYETKCTEYKISDYCIVSRKKESVRRIKNITISNIWIDLFDADRDRYEFFKTIINSKKLMEDSFFGEGIGSMASIFGSNTIIKGDSIKDPLYQRHIIIHILSFIFNYEFSEDTKIMQFYQELNGYMSDKFNRNLKGIRTGKFEIFSKKSTVKELLDNFEEINDYSNTRTIHKVKGCEFDSVLVSYDDEKSFKNSIILPKINSDDDLTRIYYVAFSRAKKHLCIAIPSASPDLMEQVKDLGLNILNYHPSIEPLDIKT